MARTRRDFTPEYKDEAVKLVITTGRAVATVARELGIDEATLGHWVTAFKARNETGQTAVTESERVELLQLRKRAGESSIHTIAVVRLHTCERTRAYAARRKAEGKTSKKFFGASSAPSLAKSTIC